MSIELYLRNRNRGKSMEDVQKKYSLSEGTVYTLELGYQCYLKRIPLDDAIDIIKRY